MDYYNKCNAGGYIKNDISTKNYMNYYSEKNYNMNKVQFETMKSHLNLFPVDEGFNKGTIFRDVYKPYKNYKHRSVMPANERERLMYDVDKYNFALHEIRLYLDAYPNDEEAIKIFNQFQEQYIRAKHTYEIKYGALDIEAPNLDTSPWNWTVGRWPWEGEK